MTQYLTKDGLAQFEEELKYLQDVVLPQILDVINRAREDGDIKENAPLDVANAERERVEMRISELKDILADYEIIDESLAQGSKRVQVGSTVVIQYVDTSTIIEFKIVGASEADAVSNKISNEAPVAVAILGKKVGQEATFKINRKPFTVKILDIK